MTTVDFDQLSRYQAYPALFFTDHHVITLQQQLSPLLAYESTVNDLLFKIETAHLNEQTLIIKGISRLSAAELATKQYQIIPVKSYLPNVPDSIIGSFMRAQHWLNWDSQSQYCGRCGTILASKFDTPNKQCQQCDTLHFPRFSPAIMVLIYKEDKILLARSPHFKSNMYSAIAGFVDLGESVEQAVHREAKEELGLTITDLQYFSSQCWPFPDSLMLAFTAKHLDGEISIDANEIEDARWFNIDNLPELPSHVSISRKLIDSVINNK